MGNGTDVNGSCPVNYCGTGVEKLAKGIAKFILHSKTVPLAIGIYGPWRKGKSCFLLLVKKHLLRQIALKTPAKELPRKDLDALLASKAGQAELSKKHMADVITVWFNAWQYSGEVDIWAGDTSASVPVLRS